MASIRKRKWVTAAGESRAAFFVDFYDASGKRDRRQFTTKREADDFRTEIKGQLRAGTFRPEAAKVTVKEVAEHFLAYCEARRKRGERMTRQTCKVYEGHIRNYICPDPHRHAKRKYRHARLRAFDKGIGWVKLRELTARRVTDFRDHLRSAGVSVITTRKILATLQVMLEYAIGRDLLALNTARKVKVIGRRDEGAKKIIPPGKDAMRRLIKAADADFRVQLIVASATGMRASEQRALRWRHIDFEGDEVKLETRVDHYGDEDVTKTAAGMRTVPLGVQVVTALKEWKLRSKFKKPSDLVFPNRRGKYGCHDDMVKRKFLPLFDELAKRHAEQPEKHPAPPSRFNWHALRHFAISCWIDAGLRPKTVQTFAGHSSLQVTMDRYGHLFKSDDHKQAMDAIAKEMF